MCFESPVFFVENMLGRKPTSQQRQVLEVIAHPGSKCAIASGHGIGKSTLLSWCALWFLATRENAKIPCTAPTAHQLEDILWGELRENIARMHPWFKDQFSINKSRVEMQGSTGYIVARTARPENPEALQGFHGENLMFIIDEAAGIDDKIFEVAYGALSTPGARALMPGNPTQLTGFFYRTFHSDNSWFKFQFSSIDSELVSPEFVESAKKDYGEDSDMFRVRVLGQFPRGGMSGIIPALLVDNALSRKLRYDHEFVTYPIIGVDPAWEGEDRSVIAMRQGNYAKILLRQNRMHGDALARAVARQAAQYHAKYIFVDKTGVGASCCDFLRTMGVRHMPISFAEKPYGEGFLNKRAEIWWHMREWFERDDSTLEPYEGLRDDLIAPSYGMKENGKIYLESKEEMRKKGTPSPDMGDALALTFCIPDTIMSVVRDNVSKDTGYSQFWDKRQREEAWGSRRRLSLFGT